MSCCGGTGAWRPEQEVAEPRRHERADPLAILAERLARGEITVEEYERIREVLERDRQGMGGMGGMMGQGMSSMMDMMGAIKEAMDSPEFKAMVQACQAFMNSPAMQACTSTCMTTRWTARTEAADARDA